MKFDVVFFSVFIIHNYQQSVCIGKTVSLSIAWIYYCIWKYSFLYMKIQLGLSYFAITTNLIFNYYITDIVTNSKCNFSGLSILCCMKESICFAPFHIIEIKWSVHLSYLQSVIQYTVVLLGRLTYGFVRKHSDTFMRMVDLTKKSDLTLTYNQSVINYYYLTLNTNSFRT